MGNIKSLFLGILLIAFAQQAVAQSQIDRANRVQLNTITTAVPFLIISPDARAGGMGDVGVATPVDANALHWNPSKLAFVENDFELAISYSPWLRQLVPDINLAYVSAYKKIGRDQTIGGSLRYFSLGDINFTNEQGQTIRQFNPNEFALDATYARMLSDRISGAVSGRFVYSNLTGGINVQGADTKPGISVATDLSMMYSNDQLRVNGKDAVLGVGLNISNIGAKMAYSNSDNKDFIPINLRLGPSLTVDLDDYNSLTMTVEANKLLVPTPPVYKQGSTEISAGRDPNVGIVSGIFGSFSDAPGVVVDDQLNVEYDSDGNAVLAENGTFKEELREINLAGGFEYWYDKQFAFRGGYFHEHASKGNRKYFTLGAGLKYSKFSLDFSYLITATQQNPLANTLRFTMRFSFEQLKQASEE